MRFLFRIPLDLTVGTLQYELMKYEPELQALLDHVGGPTKLAAIAGVTPSAVTQWKRVPSRYVLKIAADAKYPVEKILPAPAGSAA